MSCYERLRKANGLLERVARLGEMQVRSDTLLMEIEAHLGVEAEYKKAVKWCVKRIRKLADKAWEAASEKQATNHTACTWEATLPEIRGRAVMLSALADELLERAGIDD